MDALYFTFWSGLIPIGCFFVFCFMVLDSRVFILPYELQDTLSFPQNKITLTFYWNYIKFTNLQINDISQYRVFLSG